MRTATIVKASLRLITGCSVVLLVAAGGGIAFAHGSGNHNGDDHNGSNHNGSSGQCRSVFGCNSNNNRPPLHGAGSSHNPIVYHPPVKPITKPVAGIGPAKPMPSPVKPSPQPISGSSGFHCRTNWHYHTTLCYGDDGTGYQVRDHRH